MAERRESWTKVGGVTAIACVFGGLYFGFMKSCCPNAAFIRDLFNVGGVALVGSVLSIAFEREKREQYVGILTMVVAIYLGGVVITKLWFKDVLSAAYSAVQLDINYLDPRAKNLTTPEEHAEYWRNY